jgi:5-formyltetrahydrofolate cyclo-ligase
MNSTLPTPSDEMLRALRRELRARRRAVPPAERRRASQSIAWRVERGGWLTAGRRIALFLSMPEEIDTAPLLARARARGCRIFVPRITDYGRSRMRFLPLSGPMRRGQFGIQEPAGGITRGAAHLHVVLMPLVGFDDRGNRIGMGKGYYDRALAFRRRQRHWKRPLLVGLAFECQRVDALPARPHDIPLDRLVTESATRRFAAPGNLTETNR